MTGWLRSVLVLLSSLVGTAVAGDVARTPHVEVRLVAEQSHVEPGRTHWVALAFDLIPNWHIYWRNPGDSGEAPRITWRLPTGWRAGDIHWPVPKRIPVGPLTNYGYEDRVMLLVPITPAAEASSEPVQLAADATWLVCEVECIPEQATLSLTLSPDPATAAPPELRAAFEHARRQWPRAAPFDVRYRAIDDVLELQVAASGWQAERISDLWFASNDWGPVAPSGAQTWSIGDGQLRLRVPPGDLPPAVGTPLDGLLVLTESTGDGAIRHGFSVTAEPATAVTAAKTADANANATETDSTLAGGLGLALGLALLGGLLLNLMPCVLPVLSIKVLGFVGPHGHHGARQGIAFTAGVILTFSLLALGLIALRGAGQALGWGFQLQEPVVIVALMYLMLALAMNLSGVFTMGAGLMGIGQNAGGATGAFGTGVLAVVVASPCTAPFMGTALGYALTRPAHESLLVFLALGLGFALPVLLLSIWPAWLKRLPPPGPWMERLRNGLAFPMYGAAAWLLWVLSQQVDATGLAAALAGAVLLALALWWLGQPLRNRFAQRTGATLLALAAAGLAIRTSVAPGAMPHASLAGAWSPDRVAEHRRAGRTVLVNFTAAWCITCKVNEQVALDTDTVRDALRVHDVAYLKGDWTRRDAAITAELQRYGRSGVPLYLLYPPGDGEPQILPQVLTPGLVVEAIENI